MKRKLGKNINCLLCEKSFYIQPYQIGLTKYCSPRCANKGKKKKMCIHGHKISTFGRNKFGGCNGCRRPVTLGLRTRKQVVKIVKRICKHNHDTFITGRDKDGKCSMCRLISNRKSHPPHPRKPKQFCPRGHDTFVHGRSTDGSCRICHNRRATEWAKSHPENRAAIMRTMRKNIAFKLGAYLRVRIRAAIKDNVKNGSAVRDLGCTLDFLKLYVEKKFYAGMTWENWGTYWDLDHIKELHTFDLTNRTQFLKACHYTNLQPLTIPDHVKKTAKERKKKSKLIKNKN